VQTEFEREMSLAVTEEAYLAELPAGITDIVDGGQVEHGPWEPAACSELLLRWFDRGLIELYDMREGHPNNRCNCRTTRDPDRPCRSDCWPDGSRDARQLGSVGRWRRAMDVHALGGRRRSGEELDRVTGLTPRLQRHQGRVSRSRPLRDIGQARRAGASGTPSMLET
jgi:hypothetical protein